MRSLRRLPGFGGLVLALLSIAATTAQPLTVGQIQATFVESESATLYTISASSPGASLTYQWRLIPPSGDPTCNKFHSSGNTAAWHHGDLDGCNHKVQVAQGHPGTVIVTVSNGGFTCTATYFGTISGRGPLPQCGPFDQATPTAVTTAPGAPPDSHGIPAWQVAVAVVVFLAVGSAVGWFALTRGAKSS
jgi:hypothetical protein